MITITRKRKRVKSNVGAPNARMQRVPSAGRPEIVERYKDMAGGGGGREEKGKVDGREKEVETLKW